MSTTSVGLAGANSGRQVFSDKNETALPFGPITRLGLGGPRTLRQSFSGKTETDLPSYQITRLGLAGARTFRDPFTDKAETFIGEGIGLWNYPVAYRKRKVR